MVPFDGMAKTSIKFQDQMQTCIQGRETLEQRVDVPEKPRHPDSIRSHCPKK